MNLKNKSNWTERVRLIWQGLFPKKKDISPDVHLRFYALWFALIAMGFVAPMAEILYAMRVTHTVPRDSILKILMFGVGVAVGIGFANQSAKVRAIKMPEANSQASGRNDEDTTTPVIQENGWEGFDQDAPSYPEELDIALQAWRAVSLSEREGAIKEQLVRWIRDNYPEQSANSIDRIATVANWDKSGGRPKSSY